MSNKINISIVIPLFNEEESISQLIQEVLAAMKQTKEKFEIIVVNDGSVDNTANVLAKLIKKVPELICIFLRKNYGLKQRESNKKI